MDTGIQRDWPTFQADIERTRRELHGSRVSRLFGPIRNFLEKNRGFPSGVYILTYHGVVDEAGRREWEHYYTKGEVSLPCFEEQLDFMLEWMAPIRLSKIPGLWGSGKTGPDKPYFVITFDDGYENVLRNALAPIQKRGIIPTVFINSSFARGEVYYRILAAIICGKGHGGKLARHLRESHPNVDWSEDGNILFNQTKENYVPGIMEQAVSAAFKQTVGSPADWRVHLNLENIRRLSDEGWEFGNHTVSHRLLSSLKTPEIESEIENNESFWREQSIPLIDWLAYPNGRSKDVNSGVKEWLERHLNIQGAFCSGGVNLFSFRTEWMRFGLGNASGEEIGKLIWREINATRKAMKGRNL